MPKSDMKQDTCWDTTNTGATVQNLEATVQNRHVNLALEICASLCYSPSKITDSSNDNINIYILKPSMPRLHLKSSICAALTNGTDFFPWT